MRNDPLIYQGCAVKRTKAKPARPSGITNTEETPPEATEQKGELMIRDLWQNVTESLHNMHIVNTDAKSYWEKSPEK